MMKAWYSKVRDTELIDGSVRADYVVTFETDNFELKRKVEKYLQGIMDEAEQTEPSGKRGEMMSQKEFDEMVHRVVSGQTEPKCEECQHYGHKVKRCLLNKCKYE